MKPIKLTDAQIDAALGLEITMDDEATGNRKCWHVIDNAGVVFEGRLTLSQARQIHAASRIRGYCRDGFKLVECDGAAHSNPHIDNCWQCAPRWGWVMVPDGEEKRDLTTAEIALLNALK